MGFFHKKSEHKSFDPAKQKPILHCSICNGEQVAGFKDLETGHFEEVMLIKNATEIAKEAGKLIYPAFLSLFLRLILLCDVLLYFEWYIICFSKVVQ